MSERCLKSGMAGGKQTGSTATPCGASEGWRQGIEFVFQLFYVAMRLAMVVGCMLVLSVEEQRKRGYCKKERRLAQCDKAKEGL